MDVNSVYHLFMSLFFLSLVLLGDCTFGLKMRKICKDSIEILSGQGVMIENYHKSHVKMALVDHPDSISNSEFQLSFDFRTTSPDGILFYGRSRGHRELIALILSGGDLIYKVQCPTLHADILLPTINGSRLNDGEWHRISYSIYRPYDTKGHIEIDGFASAKRYIVSCDPLTTLIMGGYSEHDRGQISDLENLQGHFEGCIRNVYVPVPLRYPPKYYAVSVCE
uniref:Laminin G domain-containing protein n=1 Tax=Arion vulgaris TaxID=1028688 RepID=A0A0B7AR34_9EUPU